MPFERIMTDTEVPSAPSGAQGLSSLGSAGDQACNECKRRKGRCDRQLPECGPCARNKRHCLYEKHSKTPLTRRYLTEIEARLRQTETRLKNAELRAQRAEAKVAESLGSIKFARDANGLELGDGSRLGSRSNPVTPESGSSGDVIHSSVTPSLPIGLEDFDWNQFPRIGIPGGVAGQDHPVAPVKLHELEQPPSEVEDFSWDEQSTTSPTNNQWRADHSGEAESSSITDGMGALSVEDRGSGYLGVASGAAMLRLLLPEGGQRRKQSVPRNASDKRQQSTTSHPQLRMSGWVPTPVWQERLIYEIDLDRAIDAYFQIFHQSYPIVHEPTFRAQYAQVITRPSGGAWNALAYIIAAIGLLTTATEPTVRDLDLFEAAKSNLSINSFETGNLTLVQTLVLMSNYIQKRDKPNSGYNYIGLALHMAMGLGLHKEFQGWQIPPLELEIRRRVWWVLFCFYVGATITFGRPLAWPANGIEVALPLNVNDRDLNNASGGLPLPRHGLTTHSAIAAQARFFLATLDIYAKVISTPFPSAQELIQLDNTRITPWYAIWADEAPQVEPRFVLSRSVMDWRMRNIRIIMYRPFVIRKVLRARNPQTVHHHSDQSAEMAVSRCLSEAQTTIASIYVYWSTGTRHCMASWYALFFLFQAAMMPCVCLRNEPESNLAQSWRDQLLQALGIMQSMFVINPSSRDCYDVVLRLCSSYLPSNTGLTTSPHAPDLSPVEESPSTQIENLYTMMWPGANTAEVDMLIDNDSWNHFIADLSESPQLMNQQYEPAQWK